jgi:hypothetical protein
MPLSGLRLGDISAGALSSLIDNGVREARRIDYKLIVGTDHLSSWLLLSLTSGGGHSRPAARDTPIVLSPSTAMT